MARAKTSAKRKRGRPTKATAATRTALLDYLRRGLYAESAARLAGIGEQTFYAWMARSDAGDPEFAGFSEAVKKATAEAEAEALLRIRDGSPGWQGSAWFLERRLRDRWRPPRITGPEAAAGAVTVNFVGPHPFDGSDRPAGGAEGADVVNRPGPSDGDSDAGKVPAGE